MVVVVERQRQIRFILHALRKQIDEQTSKEVDILKTWRASMPLASKYSYVNVTFPQASDSLFYCRRCKPIVVQNDTQVQFLRVIQVTGP